MYGLNYGYQAPSYQLQTDERIWVQNEQSAEAYLVAPNSFVRLWDAQKPIFYEKRADASGRPLPLEVYEYTKRQRTMPTEALVNAEGLIDYKKDLEALTRRIEALEKGAKHEQSDADDSTV